jgi:mannose-1-phosphate guanylyltransferase / phosphomannomutase
MAMVREVKKAMILAAGEGTRLRPLTLETPKVLLLVGGVPLVEYTVAWLKSHGISEVAINLYHLGSKISDCLGDGSRFGMKIVYSEEETLLGTAGSVKKMEHFFNSTFVVFYGDNLTDFDLSAMVEFHLEKKAVATLAIFESSNLSEVGIVEIDKNGRISRLIEKPKSAFPNFQLSSTSANGGVYVLEKKIFNYIPSESRSDFASDIFPKLLASGIPVYGYRLSPEDYFLDIGTMHRYQQSNTDMKAGKVRIEHGKQSSFPR